MSAEIYELPRVAHPIDQRQRFAWLLEVRRAARKALDVALSVPRKVAAFMGRLAHRVHLSGSVSWLRHTAVRFTRPLMSMVGRLGRTGIAAAAISVAANPTCRRLIGKAGSAVGSALSWAVKKVYSGVDRVLRFFGRPGNKAADLLFSGVVSLGGKIAFLATPVVHRVARFTDPEAAHVRLVSGLARSYVLHRALKVVIGNRFVRAVIEGVVIPALVDSRVGQWIAQQLRVLRDRITSLREQAEKQPPLATEASYVAPEGDDPTDALIDVQGRVASDAPANRAERRAVQRLSTGTDGMSHYPAPKARRKH